MNREKKVVSTVRCSGIRVSYHSVKTPTERAVEYTYTFYSDYPFGDITVKDTKKSLFAIGKDYTITIASTT